MTKKIVTRKEAQEQGLTRYFTGKPCKRGHIAERTINGGCVECVKPYAKQYHAANNQTEERKAYMRNYMKEYFKKNPDKAEKQREYVRKHRAKVRAMKKGK